MSERNFYSLLSKALCQVEEFLLQAEIFVVADCYEEALGVLLKWMRVKVARLQQHRRYWILQRSNGDDCEKLKNKRSHDADDLEMRASTFN
jgi:hypothetical protein